MTMCCKRFKQSLQGRFFDKFFPLNAFAINLRIESSIQQDQNLNLTQFCQQVHKYYIKEQKVNLLANTYKYKFTKPISMGLIDLLPKKTEYSSYSRSKRQEVMPQCIHSLELLSKNAETTYFSLDDVQTTYSSFMEDPNWSFIEDSLVANE